MTKITILGQTPEKKELKKIEFVKTIINDGTVSTAQTSPCQYDNIELIRQTHRYDFMFAYNSKEGRNDGLLYLGHFNDGVV